MTENRLELPLEEFAVAVSSENRRLHEEIERLREALRKIAKSQLSDSEQAYIFKMLARAALGEEE